MNNSKIFDLSPYPLLQQIGQSPLVQVDLTRDQFPEIEVYAKAEMLNPGGSIKDRPVLRMLTQAILAGDLTKNKVILDSSSGNAGIAYAMIGAVLGYEVELVIPENASQERKKRMQAHNANLVFTDAVHGYDAALREVHRRYHALPEKYFMADQYKNENNWRAHFETTAAEILQQTEGKITHFVAGVGTGGTITGVGRRFKEFNPDIQICSIVPDDFPGIEGLKPSILKPFGSSQRVRVSGVFDSLEEVSSTLNAQNLPRTKIIDLSDSYRRSVSMIQYLNY